MRKSIFAAGAALVLLAGCGGKDDNGAKVASISSPPASSSAAAAANGGGPDSAADADKMRAFAKCMRDHGIDMPDPQPGANGGMTIRAAGKADEGKMDAAQNACKNLLPNGGQPKPMDPATLDKLRKQAKCMRDHGVDMPDPTPDGRGTVKIGGAGKDDPAKLDAAMKACGLGEGGMMPAMPAAPAK